MVPSPKIRQPCVIFGVGAIFGIEFYNEQKQQVLYMPDVFAKFKRYEGSRNEQKGVRKI